MAQGGRGGQLLATIVGGLLAIGGTLGTLVLTHERADDAEAKRATGASRVLADNLRRGEDVMADSLTDCRYRLYNVPLTLPHDNLLLLAWRLKPAEWEAVAQAMATIKLQVGRSQEPRRKGFEFTQDDVTQIRFVIGRIDRARRGLEEVSGVKPYPAKKVREEQARGADC